MKHCIILLTAVCFVMAGGSAPACTGLVVQDGERVLVGNNEDWFNPRTNETPSHTTLKGPVQNPAQITFMREAESARDRDWVLTLRIEK